MNIYIYREREGKKRYNEIIHDELQWITYSCRIKESNTVLSRHEHANPFGPVPNMCWMPMANILQTTSKIIVHEQTNSNSRHWNQSCCRQSSRACWNLLYTCILGLSYHVGGKKTFVCGDMTKTMTRIKTGCCCWIQSKVQTSSAYWYHLASEFQVSGTVMHCTKRCLADKVFAHDHCNHDRQTHFGKWTYCEFMYCGLKMWNAFPVGTVSYLEYVIMCPFWAKATEHQYTHVFNANTCTSHGSVFCWVVNMKVNNSKTRPRLTVSQSLRMFMAVICSRTPPMYPQTGIDWS
jgi:hypothetical protein